MSQTSPGDPGTPTDHHPPPGDGGPRVGLDEIKDLGRIRRSAAEKKVAGVAAGIARHLDIDPVVVRIAFVVLALFGGGGILLYAACWLFVPDERTNQATINVDDRSRTVILAIVGVIAALSVVGDTLGGFGGFPWPLVVIAIVAVVLISRKQHRPHPGPWPTLTDDPGPSAPAAPDATDTASVRGPEPTYDGYRPPRPPDPRRRGPVLFWFTAGLALTSIAVLLALRLADVAVPTPAFPAAVVAACGLMLVVGAFWGRAGGLIPVGLVFTLVTVLFSLGAQVPSDGVFMGQQHRTPATLSELDESYTVAMGELKIDLTEADLSSSGTHDLEINVIMGHAEIVVPEDLTVTGTADVGLGEVKAFGDKSSSGSLEFSHHGDGPELRLDASSTLGNIEIYVEGERS